MLRGRKDCQRFIVLLVVPELTCSGAKLHSPTPERVVPALLNSHGRVHRRLAARSSTSAV